MWAVPLGAFLLSSSAFQYRFNCESEIFSAFSSTSSCTTAGFVCGLIGTSTPSSSGTTFSLDTLSTVSASAASETLDVVFLVYASVAEGFVPRAVFELKDRIGCAAAFRIAADVLPLLRRPRGILCGDEAEMEK